MPDRLERRLAERMATLTLRTALSFTAGLAALLATVAAVLERLIDPAFDSMPQALWFSVTTVSTVGYGDYVPASGAGRIVAAVLMIAGVSLIPLITSVVVAIMVAQRNRVDRERDQHQLGLILDRLESIERKLPS